MLCKIILVNISLVILVIGALGCSSQPTATAVPTKAPSAAQPTNTNAPAQAATTAPTSAPAASNPTQAASTSGKKLYACSLLSREEVKAILGKPVINANSPSQPGTESVSSICSYQVPDAPNEHASLAVARFPDAKSAQTVWAETKTSLSTMFSAEPQAVSGLGDEAFWIAEPPSRQLLVRQNDFMFNLGFSTAQDAQVEQLAKKMLGHFEDVFIMPPADTTTAQQPTSAPTDTAGASNTFDGEWEGRSSNNNSLVGFRVEKNKIESVNVNFEVGSGPCQGLSGGTATSADHAPIQDNGFVANVDSGNSKVEFKGTFQSPTQASGTFHLVGKSTACGGYELDAEWTAIPASLAEATAAAVKPTDSPAAAAPSGDACAIFLQADLEEYLGKKVKFRSDDASGWTTGGGKVSACEYVVEGTLLDASQLILRDMGTPKEAQTYHENFVQEFEKMGAAPQAVSGVGDKAIWLPGLEFFTARAGKYFVLVSIAGQKEPDAKLQAFVNEMLSHLPQ